MYGRTYNKMLSEKIYYYSNSKCIDKPALNVFGSRYWLFKQSVIGLGKAKTISTTLDKSILIYRIAPLGMLEFPLLFEIEL